MIKDIAVHLDGTREDDHRIAHVANLARALDAHVTGLVENVMFEIPVAFDGVSALTLPDTVIAELDARAARRVEAARLKVSETGLRHEVRRVDAVPGAMPDAIARHVRTSDLFVGMLPYQGSTGGQGIAEAVLFNSARPCLFLPSRSDPQRTFSTVLVAWKDTREAARAVAEALPILGSAEAVVVAIVEEHGAAERFGDDVSAGIGRYLSRQGIKAEMRKINGWESASDALANEADQIGAELVVMGGYGHSRFREWAFGGVTREFLSSASIPVLMAHGPLAIHR
jgi:nucleotide-binding universal stress UspA family protein